MRARMFRDDLERVVDEIENSAIMWLGISKNAHGYDAIDVDDQVTVRSEVARLTRLYDKAVKTNTLNDPDNYSMGGPSDMHAAALRDKSGLPVTAAPPPPAPAAAASSSAPAPAADPAPAPAQDPDASPATTAPEPPKAAESDQATETKPAESEQAAETKPTYAEAAADKGKAPVSSSAPDSAQEATSGPSSTDASKDTPQPPPASVSAPAPAPAPAADPDESPASAAHLQKHSQDTSNDDDVKK